MGGLKCSLMYLKEPYPGAEEIAVHVGRAKEPYLVITGAHVEDLDHLKIAEYLLGCDWTDRGARGYTTPRLRCDEFLKFIP